MGKTAIILGATGLTGSVLLQQLLDDSRYDKIKLFSRSASVIKHEKVEEYLIDLFELKSHQDKFRGDVVFCCIGTTKAKTPDQEEYLKIDYGIPVSAAEMAKENGIKTFIAISALGANKDSKTFYNRTKGKMEEAVLAEQIPHTYLLQPSLIGGKRDEKRAGEDFGKIMLSFFDPFLMGSLKKYKAIKPQTIARCMVLLDNTSYPNNRILSDDIKEIAK
ncbi:NAD-dependent epimerase/dehydratase family protein [Bizionia argentinensis JUB59]|uniref:NAD-dependent epimerase/dehydratase family protein n=1 Tax=Bizionia argentinensis JUB59 TaxID=1046627 RepID=G2EEN8_9FLAO|nr:NAD(P)H-binding protein [Bizionia argentinensis]EGV43140.1 NAD-dependent epimerase/dehydratase family protein [Bizionia argentinensis JUB59]